MGVLFILICLIGGGIYLYIQYEKEQERKEKEEADKSLIKDKEHQIEATIGGYDGCALVRDTDNRFVGFFFYDRLKQVKLISARLNKIFDLPYDNIIDCKAFTKTIVGESKTTAETTTDYSRNFYDPNATITKFITTKEPDTTFHIIKITTSQMSTPLITFIGEYEDIYKLEALIKIVIRNNNLDAQEKMEDIYAEKGGGTYCEICLTSQNSHRYRKVNIHRFIIQIPFSSATRYEVALFLSLFQSLQEY